LKVVHKAPRHEVAQNYLNALEKDGWELTGQPNLSEQGSTFLFGKV
jgi:hypothetical protein